MVNRFAGLLLVVTFPLIAAVVAGASIVIGIEAIITGKPPKARFVNNEDVA